jgi:uncharacterized membrane protein YkvA (DUF1232 family)
MRDLWRIWQLLRDPSVPRWKWFLPIGALVYLLSPIDLIPLLPFDDIAVVIVAISVLLQMASRNERTTTTDPQGQSGATSNNKEQIVDTTWQVVDK